MNDRITLAAMTIYFVFGLSGCQTEIETMNEICGDITSISTKSDNCEEMAKELSPVTKRFVKEVRESTHISEDEAVKKEYGKAVQSCMDAYKLIMSGPCGNNKDVVQALPESIISTL